MHVAKYLVIPAFLSVSIVSSTTAFCGYISRGKASYYSVGTRTASGEHYNPNGYTAAHRTLPFGTRLRVTNMNNGRSVVVRVNDRGPFIRGRVMDLSRGAAKAIGMVATGTATIRFARID